MQKVPQNLWNAVTPHPLSPFNVQNVVKVGESKTTSKLLDSGGTPDVFPKETNQTKPGKPTVAKKELEAWSD